MTGNSLSDEMKRLMDLEMSNFEFLEQNLSNTSVPVRNGEICRSNNNSLPQFYNSPSPCMHHVQPQNWQISAQYSPATGAPPTGFEHSLTYPSPMCQSTGFESDFQKRIYNKGASMSSNENKNMTIQIGVNCVHENQTTNVNMARKSIEQNGSIMKSSNDHSHQSNFGTTILQNTCPKESYSNRGFDRGSYAAPVDITELCEQFKDMARQGGILAKHIAEHHQSRPCFKKIDDLCARIQQDVVRPDGVLANINSQGMAWVVKDFIFGFTRIVSTWTIFKGYAVNPPEGLNKVKSLLSPGFSQSFAAWQETSFNLCQELIQSFTKLDNLVQSQGIRTNVYNLKTSTPRKSLNFDEYCKNTTPNIKTDAFDASFGYHNPINSGENNYFSLLENPMSPMVRGAPPVHSENAKNEDLKKMYIKTGTYYPKQKKTANRSNNDDNESVLSTKFNHGVFEDESLTENFGLIENFQNQLVNLLEQSGGPGPTLGEGDGGMEGLCVCAKKCNTTKQRAEKLDLLIRAVRNIPESEYFFTISFARNYFPDFVDKSPDFLDIRTVFVRAQGDNYSSIFDIIVDLKLIARVVNNYLRNTDNKFLHQIIVGYEKRLNAILSENIFH